MRKRLDKPDQVDFAKFSGWLIKTQLVLDHWQEV
jgi:hypothetical protein